jgi:hypothetical protein
MPLASAFRHLVSQSGTGAFRYRTGSPYSSTGLVPASAFRFIPVPDCLDARQSDIPVRTVSIGGGERDTHAVHVQTAGSEKFKSDLP